MAHLHNTFNHCILYDVQNNLDFENYLAVQRIFVKAHLTKHVKIVTSREAKNEETVILLLVTSKYISFAFIVIRYQCM